MDYPEKFDLGHFNLSHLLVEVAIALDSQITRGRNETNYSSVNKLADILRETSRELRIVEHSDISPRFTELIPFLEKSYRKSGEKFLINAARKQSKELIDLSEELVTAHKLPKRRVEHLRDICNKLSEAASEYYARYHP